MTDRSSRGSPVASVLSMNWSTAPVIGSRRISSDAIEPARAPTKRAASITWNGRS
jgi:hypothetical protein